jgi:polysaccharide export outer membrane protein
MAVCLSALCAAAAPRAATAQQLPGGMTPEEARRLLLQSPALAELVRRQLQAAGYPPELLDAILGSGTVDAGASTTELLQALGALQIELGAAAGADSAAARLATDSARADSLARQERARGALELFGLSVFRQPTTQFRPPVTGPVDDSYVLGPGDQLVLILTGAVQVSHQLDVLRDGFIVIPEVGQVQVANLTLGQLREVLYDRLSRAFSTVTRGPNPRTRFEITVSRVRTQTIRVAGEVGVPGSYSVAASGGVLSALYDAGGPSDRGNFRRVEVRRGRELVATVDLYDYLLHGIVPNDVPLRSGDVVFVPVRGRRVKVAGEVTRPGVYELTEGEGLADLVAIAGGLTPEAATHTATIDRIIPPRERESLARTRTVVTVDLGRAVRTDAPDVRMESGDSVTVFSIRALRRASVAIRGGVWQPGTYALEPGMRLSDLLAMAGGLLPDSYTGRAQIVRTHADSSRQLIGVGLDGADGAASDPVLAERDQVTIFARSAFRPSPTVTVSGAVRTPGSVVYAESLTVRDVVLLAGGLTEDAYLLRAEVARPRAGGANGDSLAVVFRVALDSSYLFYGDGAANDGPPAVDDPETVLEPYDHVFIRRRPDWSPPTTVWVTGEVRFPGPYALLAKQERLVSVLERAGGLTSSAYANGIAFYRAGPPGRRTRLGIDLERVLRDADHAHNVALQPGDSIHIPVFTPIVTVEGAVNAPTAVPYRPGAGVGYYVDGAGGFTAGADKGKTFVRQPNGLVEKDVDPEAGAVVVVPAKEGRGSGTLVLVLSALAPLLSAATTIVVALAAR